MTSARAIPARTLALAAALLALAGCYDLPTVNPGPRWIDQFNRIPYTNQLQPPTWGVFSPWTCGNVPIQETDGGQPVADGGPMDGSADGGQASSCGAGPGDTSHTPGDTGGLLAPFQLPGGRSTLEFVVSTGTMSGGTVDFTGFKQLVFSAMLETADPSAPLPTTTSLHVDLDCPKNTTDPVATQRISDLQLDNPTWQVLRPELNQFTLVLTSGNQACLSTIEAIRFVVVPGDNNLPLVTGALSLDNVSLQN